MVTFMKKLPGRVTDAIGDLFGGIKSAFKSAMNYIIRAWNRLDIEVGPFRIPSWVPVVGGKSFHIKDIFPDIPTMHSGGIFRAPTPGGEGLAILRDREEVSMPGAAAGQGIYVANMDITIVDDLRDPGAGRRFIERLARDLETYNRELA